MKHCALITGASSGIGEALAYELARQGYNLYLVARRKERLQSVAENIKAQNSERDIEVIYRQVDLLHAQERIALCEDIRVHHELDMLVNNAGFGVHGWFETIEVNRQLDMIETNVVALVDLTHRCLAHMQHGLNNEKHDPKFIVNIASVGGFQAGAFYATYFASKSFVLSFSEALSEELRRKQLIQIESTPCIYVSAVCPGPTQSEFFSNAGMHPDDNSVVARMFQQSPTSDTLAKYVVAQVLKKKTVIVHGKIFKILLFLQRFMSRKMIRKITASMQKARLK